MRKPQLVAVDTNVLLRLADGHDATIDSWSMIQKRIQPVQFVALPTVLAELASQLEDSVSPEAQSKVLKALKELRSRWHFLSVEFSGVQEAVAENALRKLRDSGLIPYEERNDAAIIVEAAVLNCVLLVSRDSHLTDIDQTRLAFLFRQMDLPTPIIASPETLLKKFYPR